MQVKVQIHRRQLIGALAFSAATIGCGAIAAETWRKATAFGVEFEVPANWKRLDYRKPPDDHEEAQFAENARNIAAGAWFSVFPTNADLIDANRQEQSTVIDGRPAKYTDFLSNADDPPPRRRQVTVYFDDARAPAFLFDGNAEQWSMLGSTLARILSSIRLPRS